MIIGKVNIAIRGADAAGMAVVIAAVGILQKGFLHHVPGRPVHSDHGTAALVRTVACEQQPVLFRQICDSLGHDALRQAGDHRVQPAALIKAVIGIAGLGTVRYRRGGIGEPFRQRGLQQKQSKHPK